MFIITSRGFSGNYWTGTRWSKYRNEAQVFSSLAAATEVCMRIGGAVVEI